MANSALPSLRTTPLRDEIYRVLLDRVTSGEFPSGSRLRDVALAEALGVSRTPVREALLRLEREGFLVADHRRGFSVRGFDAREIEEAYPLVWTLEVMALRAAEPYSPELLKRLESLNRSMRSIRIDASERAALDAEWHEQLAIAAGNSRLLEVLRPLKAAISRYERSYMRSREDVRQSAEEHDLILQAMSSGNVDRAAQRLEKHWRRGMASVLKHAGSGTRSRSRGSK